MSKLLESISQGGTKGVILCEAPFLKVTNLENFFEELSKDAKAKFSPYIY